MVVVIPLFAGHAAGKRAQQQAPLAATRQADCDAFPCQLAVAGQTFTLTASGHLSKRTGNNSTRALRLPVPRRWEIDRVFVASFAGDVLIAYEVGDGEVGTARVVRVRVDRASLKQVWVVEIPAFNLSEGVFEQPYFYQAALGFVAKIDLRLGAFVWKHAGLYDHARQSFGAFQRPVVGHDDVQFIDAPASGLSPRRIVVNKRTGVMTME